jgi:hypothetical protein
MSATRFSFVLPVKLRSDSLSTDLDSVVSVAVRSIAVFFPRDLIDRFYVVAGASDLEAIEQRARREKLDLPFSFIDEIALCPSLGNPDDGHAGRGWQGWHKQQVIKIAAASIVDAPYYITLDDDVILTRHVQTRDLLSNERLAASYLPPAFHESWYRSCCEVLMCPPEAVLSSDRALGVTPQIVVTEIMRSLQSEICRLWGTKDFGECLLELAGIKIPLTARPSINRLFHRLTGRRAVRRGIPADVVERCRHWTEHQLYWTFMKRNGLADKHYSADFPAMTAQGIWSDEQAGRVSIEKWISSQFDERHDHFFTVFGSQIKSVDRARLNDLLATRIAAAM